LAGSPSSEMEQPTAAPTAAGLAVARVTKRWPGHVAPVLDDIVLDVPAGTTMVVEGHNGCGKTTLLRIASGLLAADAGTVRVSGFDIQSDRREYQRRTGFLAAGQLGLYARLNARRHLDLWLALSLLPKADRAAARDAAIAEFGLSPFAQRRVDRISMGQRQRVRMALAFAHRPEVVLLDEPANSLDLDGMQTFVGALERLTARGGSALVCVPTGSAEQIPFERRHLLDRGVLVA
jgi:ABC-2 type transport system ATP-binding protein